MNEGVLCHKAGDDRWLEAKIAGQFPICSVILHVSADTTDRPNITQYLIGEMPAGHLPFGIDRPESLEAAMDEAAAKFGIQEKDWVELSEPPVFAETFDAAIEQAIERASDALGLSDGDEQDADPTS